MLRRVFLSGSAVFLLSMVGCGAPSTIDNGDDSIDEINGGLGDDQRGRQATINVVHASPDAPAVDIYLNDGRAVADLDYRRSTGNVSLPAGRYNVKIRGAGAPAGSPAAFETMLDLAPRARLLLLARGRLGDSGGPTAFTVSAFPLAGRDRAAARLRFIHASPSAPPVDLFAGGAALVRDTAFGAASGYLRLPGGLQATTIGIRPAGGSFDLAFVRTPSAPAGAVMTAIAFGEINPLSADDRFLDVSVLDEVTGRLADLRLWINWHAPRARIYVFHASPNAPNVDVGLPFFGLNLINNLAYQKASPILQLPGASYPIEVRIAGTRTAVLSARAKLLPGLSWALFARGLVGASDDATKLGLTAVPFGAAAPGAGATNVRAIHASPGAPAVDLAKGGAVVVANLPFRQASAYLTLPTAALAGDLFVRAAGSPADLFKITVPDAVAAAVAGKTVAVYATGTLGDAGRPFTAVAVVEEGGGALLAVPLPTVPAT